MADKPDFKQYKKTEVTPAGKGVWVKVFKPDTKFNAKGVFSVDLVLTPDEAEPLIARLTEIKKENADAIKKAFKGKNVVFKDLYDEETTKEGTKTGNYVFKFKATAETFKGDPITISVVDSKGKDAKHLGAIGNGSLIKVAYKPSVWFTPAFGSGISLKLYGVQVLDLVEFDTNPFHEEEGFTINEDKRGSSNSDEDIPF